MKSQPETFEKMMQSFGCRYNVSAVFDDFLTMSLCAFSQHPGTGRSYHEDLYLETVARYKDDTLCYSFPKMLAALVLEMEARKDSDAGNDVLGAFYEVHLSQKGKGQHFTPWPLCVFMAKSLAAGRAAGQTGLRILDPCCGSGRMLLAMAKEIGPQHEFYGIGIDPVCVKMTAVNLFLNGLFHAEVLCADALALSDFRMSYITSLFPFGVFRIDNKEDSPLWHMQQASLKPDTAATGNAAPLLLPSEEGGNMEARKPEQLRLF